MGSFLTPEQVARGFSADLPRDARALLAWAVPRAITADRLQGLPRMVALGALGAAAPGVDAARAAVVEFSVSTAQREIMDGNRRRAQRAVADLQACDVLMRVVTAKGRGGGSVYAFLPLPVKPIENPAPRCPSCHGLVKAAPDGARVCSSCGLVVSV